MECRKMYLSNMDFLPQPKKAYMESNLNALVYVAPPSPEPGSDLCHYVVHSQRTDTLNVPVLFILTSEQKREWTL